MPIRVHSNVLLKRLWSREFSQAADDSRTLAWVFLGPPGVGKGTYSKRVAEALGFAHIAAGDLVREEIKAKTPLGLQMQDVVNSGQLLSDKLILRVLRQRMRSSADSGVHRFLLDGFPRTEGQARALEGIAEVQLAVNLDLREEVLVEKCLGRRMCSKCGGNFNVANIHYPAKDGKAEIIMPPLDPPADCIKYMEQRDDDTMETILRRLEIYKASAKPVEDYYEKKGILCNYEITGGIPETMPVLMEHVLQKAGHITNGYHPENSATIESVGVSPA